MKKVLITYTDSRGENITLYRVKTRIAGTRQVFDGILLHNNRWEDSDRDNLICGVFGLNDPETPEEAEILVELSRWSNDFRIDGNGYYIFTD